MFFTSCQAKAGPTGTYRICTGITFPVGAGMLSPLSDNVERTSDESLAYAQKEEKEQRYQADGNRSQLHDRRFGWVDDAIAAL
ncbi:MAG: hypothetical protein WBF79_04145 [Rhodococcus sp. (in: high G+C Gram-positive bacteria)]